MTHEKPQEDTVLPEKNIEESLSVSYDKIQELLTSLKETEGREYDHKDEIKSILTSLETALREREIAIEELEGTEIGYTDSGNVNLQLPRIIKTMAKIKKVLLKYDNFEADSVGEVTSPAEFETPDSALDLYPEYIQAAKDLKSAEAITAYIINLKKAEGERMSLLEHMEENPEKPILNEKGEVLKKKEIQESIAKIRQILRDQGEGEAEEIKRVQKTPKAPRAKRVPDEKAGVKPETVEAKRENEFDYEQHILKFSDDIVESMARDITKDPKVLENFRDHLLVAQKEREELLKTVLENKQLNYIDENNMFFTEERLRKSVSKIKNLIEGGTEAGEEQESEFTLKVSDENIAEIPAYLENALKTNNVDDFERIMNILRETKHQLEENPKSVFKNQKGEILSRGSRAVLLSAANSILDEYSKKRPAKPEETEVEQGSLMLEGVKKSYANAVENIDAYSKELESGTIDAATKKDITRFINGVRRNMGENAEGIKGIYGETYPALTFIQERLEELKKLEEKLGTASVKNNSKKPEKKPEGNPAEKYEHTSIKNKINELSEKLKKESGNTALHAEIQALIDEYKPKIEGRIAELDSAKVPDFSSPEYISAAADLPRLISLEDKLKVAIQNEEENAKNKMPDELMEKVATLFASVTEKTNEYLEKLKQPVTPELKAEIEKFIKYGQQTFEEMKEEVKGYGPKTQQHANIAATLKSLTDLQRKLIAAKEKVDPVDDDEDDIPFVDATWGGYSTIDVHRPGEPLYIPDDTYEVLETHPDMIKKINQAVGAHNKNIIDKKSSGTLRKSMRAVEKLRKEANQYKKEYLAKQEEDAKPVPEEDPKPEEKPVPDENNEVKQVRMFTMDKPNVNYAEIADDAEFDIWLKKLARSMENRGIDPEDQTQDLAEWFEEYQECIPYAEKLRTVRDALRKSEGKNSITTLMTENKITDLLLDIHLKGESARAKIDSIFSGYEDLQTRIAEVERAKQANELKVSIAKQRTDNETRIDDLKPEQIRAILETRGEVNARENINEMVEFLKDIELNYDFYSKEREDEPESMYRIFRRRSAVEGEDPKKLKWYQKMSVGLSSRWPWPKKEVDLNEFNNFERVMYKIRNLDLVDRKTGSLEKRLENKARMTQFIRFCTGQEFLLAKHMTDPQSNKEAELDDEQKEMLKVFDELMKTFSDSRYRGEEAKEKAEALLETMGGPVKEKIEDLTPDMEMLFDDSAEVEIFEREATKEVNRESLSNLEKQIDRFMKAGIETEELASLANRFAAIISVLEKLGNNDSDKMNINITRLKLENLVIKYMKKDTFKDLSKAFPLYDQILQSPDRKPEEKRAYIEELLTILKKQQKNKTNTMGHIAIYDATIARYEQTLKGIK